MKLLSPLDRVAFSELIDLCRIDAEGDVGPYKPNGSFIEEARNGETRRYWYYRGYERSFDGSPGTATKTYVGPVGDDKIDAIVAAHAGRKASYTSRRQLAARLKRAGLPAPSALEGEVVTILSRAGVLTSGSVIVGSAAFQTYGGLLGIRPERRNYKTQDIDVAQPRGLVLRRGPDQGTAILLALKQVDPSFAPYFHAAEPRLVRGFRNAQDFRLEFLTPLIAARGGARLLTEVAGLPGVGAQQLKFLEFSLKGATESVMLHDAGIIVPVPDPARFAVHKLIVAATRRETDASNASKAFKDVLQAEDIIDGIARIRDTIRLGSAWLEAWNRGPRWRHALRAGTLRVDANRLTALSAAVTEAAISGADASPFEAHQDPRQALLVGERQAPKT